MSRTRIAVALFVIGGGLAWILVQGLGENLVYYRTTTEIVGEGDALVGEAIRLGGVVVSGSFREVGDEVRFEVTDGSTRVGVVGTGGVPSLFREGQGVVVEGEYGRDGLFRADTVLVKHGSVYRPPEPGETPTTADLEAG